MLLLLLACAETSDESTDSGAEELACELQDWWLDDDGDGYGDAGRLQSACEMPPEHVDNDRDCDDADSAIHPGAEEPDCTDPVDYNCDGSTGYADVDGDGAAACEDCDDAEAAVHPGAVEVCDGNDNDCDSTVDEDVTVTFYTDSDGDGYGDASSPVEACELPSGAVSDAADCDDSEGLVSPAAVEVCDGIDNNCDGVVDEETAADASSWHPDADGDGYGDEGTVVTSCASPAGFTSDGADCNDLQPRVNPDAEEICDGYDNNCDSTVDEDVTVTFYADSDGDGYGDASSPVEACELPTGYVSDSTDCDDSDSTIVGPGWWGDDEDEDGACEEGTAALSCTAPSADAVACEALDCDDEDDSRSELASESCDDGIDNDCDGLTDCEDGDCALECEESCTNGIDDDADGLMDCSDDDCWGVEDCLLEVEVSGGIWFAQRGPSGGGVHRYQVGAVSATGEVRGWNTASASWQTCDWQASLNTAVTWVFSYQTTFAPSRSNVEVSSSCGLPSSAILPQALVIGHDGPSNVGAYGWYSPLIPSIWMGWYDISPSPFKTISTGSYPRRYYDIIGHDSTSPLRLQRP